MPRARPFHSWRAASQIFKLRHYRRSARLAQLYIPLYLGLVRFSWDPKKSEANLAARGFDFEFATLIFDGRTLEKADDRKDYGERRVMAIGMAQGLHLTVAYTDRLGPSGEIERRIISARRSNRRERKAYSEAVAKR
jgi:uncharacterized DUF497 family protein